jgi:hypothetical protein
MCAATSTAIHYFAALFHYSLAVGLKRLGHAARGAKRVIHGVEQRQITQQGKTANVALRKNITGHRHGFRLTSGLRSPNFLDFMQKWQATK